MWKQLRCPSTGEWIETIMYIHTVKYYSTIKSNEVFIHATWMKLEMFCYVTEASDKIHISKSTFIWDSQKRPIHRDNVDYLLPRARCRGWGMKNDFFYLQSFILRWWKCPKNNSVIRCHAHIWNITANNCWIRNLFKQIVYRLHLWLLTTYCA